MRQDETKVEYFIRYATEKLLDYIPNMVGAFIILLIGIILIKILRRVITSLITKRPDHDPTLLKFVLDAATWTLRILLFVAIVVKLGVESSTFVAAIGAAGLAIGLSLQGSLSNFSGGLLIILFKPFRVGDYIEAQGQAGTVNGIQIFSTRLITPNNQVVYLPNGTLSNNTIKNFSQEPQRRAEIVLGVDYNSNLKHVKEVIMSVIKSDDKILETPAPFIEIRALADSSINVAVYIWADRPNYALMVSDFYENIKLAFEKEQIEIPFPHQDLNIKYVPKTNDSSNS